MLFDREELSNGKIVYNLTVDDEMNSMLKNVVRELIGKKLFGDDISQPQQPQPNMPFLMPSFEDFFNDFSNDFSAQVERGEQELERKKREEGG
jgi:hypothetical protein